MMLILKRLQFGMSKYSTDKMTLICQLYKCTYTDAGPYSHINGDYKYALKSHTEDMGIDWSLKVPTYLKTQYYLFTCCLLPT